MRLWTRRMSGALGALAVFAGLTAGVARPARAEPIPAPQSGILVGCGFLDLLAIGVSVGDHEYQFFDNGRLVWVRLLLAENEFQEPAREGHTYRLVKDGHTVGEVTYHRPPVCDSARLTVKVSPEPSCEPPKRDTRIHNGGTATRTVSTTGSFGQFVDFVDIAPGADHDFVATYGNYVAIRTPAGVVLYAPLSFPPTGCGKFTSKLTALCDQVRWDVSTKAVGPHGLAIFREFGPIPRTPVLVWSGTLPAQGRLTAYAPAVKDDTILAVWGGVRPGTNDPSINQVISQIGKFANPAACARPEQATVAYVSDCAGVKVTITNLGAERAFTVAVGETAVKTATLAPGEVTTVAVPLAVDQTATVSVAGAERFSSHKQRACQPPPSGGGSGGGSTEGGGLPITGAPAGWTATGGATLLVIGVLLVLSTRRRRRRT